MDTASSWPIEPVQAALHVTLRSWGAFEVPLQGPNKPWSRHLAGIALERAEEQVCSPVQHFDPRTGRCVPQNGRIYELDGSPGLSPRAESAWRRWKDRESVEGERNVTLALWTAMQTAAASRKA
jgi:hypothetical protein